MNTIQLFTYNNKFFKSHLERKGFSISEEYSLPINKNNFKQFNFDVKNDFTLIEIDKNLNLIFESIEANRSEKVICLASNVSDKIKKNLISKGISDVINKIDIDRIVSYLEVIGCNEKLDSGKILILEKNISNKQIFSNIITRFGYTPIFMDSVDALFEKLSVRNKQLILINMHDIDIKKLIRNTFISTDIKTTPVITFKEEDKGFFVHEIVSGLSRLTKVILTFEELLSYLVDILFKKEIIPITTAINTATNHNENSYFAHNTLKQVYKLEEEKLFSMDNIIDEINMDSLLHLTKLLERTLLKVDGFKWLHLKNEKVNINNFGSDGQI